MSHLCLIMLLRSDFQNMQNNYRGELELSAFQILTEIIGGNLSGFLNNFFKLHFINKLQWTTNHCRHLKEKARPQPALLYFSLLRGFQYFQCDLVSQVAGLCQPLCQLFQEAAIHPRPAHTHTLIPCGTLTSVPCNLPSTCPVLLHSTGILQCSQGPRVPTHRLHL